MARFYDPNTANTGLVNGESPDMGDKTGGLLADVTSIPSSQITPDIAVRAGEMNFRDTAGIPAEHPDQIDARQVSDQRPTLTIKGIGVVTPKDPNFFNLPREKQAEQVDALIAAAKKAGIYRDPVVASPDELPKQVPANEVDNLAVRGDVLPFGKTKEGNIVPAIPKFAVPAWNAFVDLIEGRRTADQITGEEVASLGSIFAPASPAAGSGRAIAQAAGLGKNKLPGAAPSVTMPTAGPETAGFGRAIVENAKNLFQSQVVEKPEVLSTPELKAASQALYKQADDLGIKINTDSFRGLVGGIISEVKREGFDRDIQPKAAAALRRLQSEVEAGASPTLSELDTLRQVAKGATTSADSNERRIARLIRDGIDNFVGNLSTKDISPFKDGMPSLGNTVTGEDASSASSIIGGARQLWAQKAKGEQIDTLFEKALNNSSSYNASGFENALKNQFKALANNPNRMRQFDAQEQAAIKNVVRGDDAQTAMRKLGAFSPTAGFFSGILSGEIVLHALEDPRLLAIPIIGGIARTMATARTNKAATSVSEMVRGGTPFKSYLNELAAQRAGEANTFGSGLQRGGLTGGFSFGKSIQQE